MTQKIIRCEYKRENPQEQQFWTTDVSRLAFLVRRAMEKNENKWIKEPEGKTIKKCIISPILTEAKIMIDEYCVYCNKEMHVGKHTLSFCDMEKLYDSSITCDKISSDIGNHLFDEPILVYIAPYFN